MTSSNDVIIGENKVIINIYYTACSVPYLNRLHLVAVFHYFSTLKFSHSLYIYKPSFFIISVYKPKNLCSPLTKGTHLLSSIHFLISLISLFLFFLSFFSLYYYPPLYSYYLYYSNFFFSFPF